MPSRPIEWYDQYENGNGRIVLTEKEHGIPALRTFGYHNTSHAISALNSHYHKNCFEFTYIAQGNIRFSASERIYSVSGGDLFVTFPNEVHDTGNIPLSVHQMYWFQLETEDPSHFLFMDTASAEKLIEKLNRIPERVIHFTDNIEAALSEIFVNISSGTVMGQIQAGLQMGVLLCRIISAAEHAAFRITPDIGNTMEYILDHISENLEMEQLAKISMLSVSRFKQKFKEQVGMSPRSFINYYKIEAAKRMLQDGNSVTDTAMELSFSSSNYFSVVFSRYTTISPTQYISQFRSVPASQTAPADFLPVELK